MTEKCPECGGALSRSIVAFYNEMVIINVICPTCDLCWEFTFHNLPFYEKYSGNKKLGDGYGIPNELR